MSLNNATNQNTTQYNVLTGGVNNLLNNVTPSATSGVPVISQGSSAQPVFGTAVVGGGGTGNTTFTAYSVIAAGTTATGAFQNVSGVGTIGQILTSNGSSALPTWQANPGFSPSGIITLSDDFIGYGIGTYGNANLISQLVWDAIGTAPAANATTTNRNPGVLGLGATFTSGGRGFGLSHNGTFGGFILGGGAITINWIVNTATLSTGTNRYIVRMGIFDGTAPPTNGIFFSYTDNVNSGNWQCNSTAASASATPISTSVAGATSYKNFQMTINAGGTSVEFFIDGASQGSIATNIPTVSITPCYAVNWVAGTIGTSAVLLDAFYLQQTLTSPR